MVRVERDSPLPLYYQIKALIREQIESGQLKPGDQVPTEDEFCQRYGISRSPVRQAMKELVYEGVLIRRPGTGTFVSEKSSPQPAAAPLSIRLMGSDPRWSEFLAHVSDAWNTVYPLQRVAFQLEVVNHTHFYETLSAAVGSGKAPDAAMVDCVWVAGLAKSEFIYPLEELSSPEASKLEDLYPAFARVNSYRGKVYGLPVKADLAVLWYRKDWLSAENLTPPKDWHELLEVARHFAKSEVQQRYGYAYPLVFPGGSAAGEATVYMLMPFIWSAGGDIFEEGQVVLDSPTVHQALEFLRALVTTHHVAPADVVSYREDTAAQLFASQQAVMALGGSYEADVIRQISGWGDEEFEARTGYSLPPAAPGKPPAPTTGGISYVILRQSASPRQVMEVLRFATEASELTPYYRAYLQVLPYSSFNQRVSPKETPLLSWVAEHMASGHSRPAIPDYTKVSRQLQLMFESLFSEATPVEALARRSAEFISVLTEMPRRK